MKVAHIHTHTHPYTYTHVRQRIICYITNKQILRSDPRLSQPKNLKRIRGAFSSGKDKVEVRSCNEGRTSIRRPFVRLCACALGWNLYNRISPTCKKKRKKREKIIPTVALPCLSPVETKKQAPFCVSEWRAAICNHLGEIHGGAQPEAATWKRRGGRRKKSVEEDRNIYEKEKITIKKIL